MMNSNKLITIASNLTYFCAGLFGLVEVEGPQAWPFFVACLALTAGSSWYHYTIDRCGQVADRLGMFAVFSTLAVIALGIPWVPVVLAAWGVLYYLRERWHSFYVLGWLATIILTALFVQEAWQSLACALGLFGVSFGAWQMGETSSLHHALWHLGTGIMIGILYGSLSGYL